MIERIVVLPDVHLTESGGAQPYVVAKKLIREMKPHEIILLGDFMDCLSVSHWIDDKRQLLENKRYLQECGMANTELDWLQKQCKEMVYLEGNHENWVVQYKEGRNT